MSKALEASVERLERQLRNMVRSYEAAVHKVGTLEAENEKLKCENEKLKADVERMAVDLRMRDGVFVHFQD
jgi:regulator of replication initiation timing